MTEAIQSVNKSMHQEKIVVSLTSAINHLENLLRTWANNKDEKAFANFVWLAAAETEYALFLFSLAHKDKSGSPSWKHASTPKQSVEVQPALVSAQDFLKRAKDLMEAGDSVRAREETWTARNILLRVEELLEKERKSNSAKTAGAVTQPQ